MDINGNTFLAADLAAQMRNASREVAAQWLERVGTRAAGRHGRLHRTHELAPHAVGLVTGIADFIRDKRDARDTPDAGAAIVASATHLATLRFAAGIDASEALKDLEQFGVVVYGFAALVVAQPSAQCTPDAVIHCANRIFGAISILEQAVVAQYLRMTAERSRQREERLRRFNRMITHELKNRVGAALGAGQLLEEEWLDSESRTRFAHMVTENAQSIQNLLENLITLSLTDESRRRVRRQPLRTVVGDVIRQQSESARSRGVRISVQPDLPGIAVNAAAVELCLSNYLSNAIKYSDPAVNHRWIEISAEITDTAAQKRAELVVRVRDNGVGVPHGARSRLFERFYRAYAEIAQIEGTGLGLNLVLETAEALGGRAWAEFSDEPGSTFAFALPCRRADEPGRVGRRTRAARRTGAQAARDGTVTRPLSGAVGAVDPAEFLRSDAEPVQASDSLP